jgi:hypothetical protein
MKSRAITLGASVIALTLAGPGQAGAGVVGDPGQKLPDTGVAPKIEANVKANVNANVKANAKNNAKALPVAVPSKGSLEGDARGSDHPRTTVEAKRQSSGDQSHVVLDWNSHGVSAYADQRRRGSLEVEGKGHAGSRHAESAVTAFGRHAGRASARGRAHTGKVKYVRAERSIREQSRQVASDVSRSAGHEKHLTPLQAIGREVGSPVQLSLAGWLIGLAGAGCLGVSRLVRRLNRSS